MKKKIKKIFWKIWYVYRLLLLSKFFYALAWLCKLLISQIVKLQNTPDGQIKLFFKLFIGAMLFGAFMLIWFMGYSSMCTDFNVPVLCSSF